MTILSRLYDYLATLQDLWLVLLIIAIAFLAGCAFTRIQMWRRWKRGIYYQRQHENMYQKWGMDVCDRQNQ